MIDSQNFLYCYLYLVATLFDENRLKKISVQMIWRKIKYFQQFQQNFEAGSR